MEPQPVDFATFSQHVEAWLTQMTTLYHEAPNHPMRDVLGQAIEQVRQGQATLKTEYQKTMDLIRERVDTVERTAAEVTQQLKDLEAQEAARAAAPIVPATPPIDPQLGFTLRQELLGRYPSTATVARAAMPAFHDFSAEYASAETSAPAASDSAGLPDAVVAGLLNLARVTSRDVVYHLGCGDGRVLISAASRFQARGFGVDSQAPVVEQARESIRKARLSSLVGVKSADPRQEDCSRATVVILSLGPAANEAVGLALRGRLKPGSRVVSADGALKSWPADQSVAVNDADAKTHRLHLWQIRAAAGGDSSIGSSGVEWDG